jgi:hypothetical protein
MEIIYKTLRLGILSLFSLRVMVGKLPKCCDLPLILFVETTARVLSATIGYLALHKDYQQQAFNEVTTFFNAEPVKWSWLKTFC